MDDLISQKEAIESLNRIPRIKGIGMELLIAVPDVEEMIAGLPTVDAVPVVRCGECGKYKMLSNDQTQVLCRGVWHGKNWFCADGEREE